MTQHGAEGEPLLELTDPVGQGRQGGDDDEGFRDVHRAEVGDEAYGGGTRRRALRPGGFPGATHPNPISSARMPLTPFLYRLTSHRTPSSW